MNNLSGDTASNPLARPDTHSQSALEPPCCVLIHNDDVTPYDYVIALLMAIFELSDELAEHIAWVAHTRGTARVVTRPRREAEQLVQQAHAAARLDGYPLTFSLESTK